MENSDTGTLTLIEIGNKIDTIRQQRHMSKRMLAELSGISESYMAQVIQGKRQVSRNVLQNIATALDVPLSAIIERDSPVLSPKELLAQMAQISNLIIEESNMWEIPFYGNLPSQTALTIQQGTVKLPKETIERLGDYKQMLAYHMESDSLIANGVQVNDIVVVAPREVKNGAVYVVEVENRTLIKIILVEGDKYILIDGRDTPLSLPKEQVKIVGAVLVAGQWRNVWQE